MEQFNNANANELTFLNNKISQVRDNYYFDTLDSDMCDRWEKILNINLQPYDDVSYRRIKISSYFAGMGNFSAPTIKNIAKYYSDADVEPLFDVPNFKVTINITSNSGISRNISDFEDVIEYFKPAFFEVKHNIISIKDYKLTSYAASTLVSTKKYQLSSDFNLNYLPKGNNNFGSNLVRATNYVLTNNIDENFDLDANQIQGSTQINAIKYELS
jgi:hypothetical protein